MYKLERDSAGLNRYTQMSSSLGDWCRVGRAFISIWNHFFIILTQDLALAMIIVE